MALHLCLLVKSLQRAFVSPIEQGWGASLFYRLTKQVEETASCRGWQLEAAKLSLDPLVLDCVLFVLSPQGSYIHSVSHCHLPACPGGTCKPSAAAWASPLVLNRGLWLYSVPTVSSLNVIEFSRAGSFSVAS